MLMTGHLRKYTECMTDPPIDLAISRQPVRVQQGLPLSVAFTVFQVNLEPGQCVSLRASPRADDPRIECTCKRYRPFIVQWWMIRLCALGAVCACGRGQTHYAATA